ncbi:hypothetical protein [Pseudoalteromonas luteoviolacea]|uniref:Vitellogenin domain-containing protein n=1 Tax=Pseudoalteromonas luteoviolacea S4060-1 TaxID=1365257 RepID=A0A167JLT5_9GAMM|nr:hypothetical protein [Pseudoalteromonas luteoviolacea]KZN61323.1 hypothetical protein N478_04460 [Pseudoalteromonas luteoviolacea S4060-1]
MHFFPMGTLGLLLLSNNAFAQHCYSAYEYKTKVQITTQIDTKRSTDFSLLSGTLHIRTLTNQNPQFNETSSAYLVYLDRAELELNGSTTGNILTKAFSHPFVLTFDEKERIQRLYSSTTNENILQQYWGLADSLHWPKIGHYTAIKSSNGPASVAITQFNSNIRKKTINYHPEDSKISIVKSQLDMQPNACLFKSVKGEEELEVTEMLANINLKTSASVVIQQNSANTLQPEHWFFKINTDTSSWPFKEKVKLESMTLKDAQAILDKNLKVMQSILDDEDEFLNWVDKNMGFLSQLPILMQDHNFNTDISVMLFWALGKLDSPQSIDIMARVAVISDIEDAHRFRAIVGMAGTESSFQRETLDSLLGKLNQNPQNNIDSSILMLLGDFAISRKKSNPLQYEEIKSSLLSHLGSGNQTKQLNIIDALGNMQSHAPDEIEMALVDTLGVSNEIGRQRIAESLEKTQPNKSATDELINYAKTETSIRVKEAMINAISKASESKKVDKFLLSNVSTEQNSQIQIAILNALKSRNYKLSETQLQTVKNSLLGQKDSEVVKAAARLIYSSQDKSN